MPKETCAAEDLLPTEVIEVGDNDHVILDVTYTADSPFGHVVLTLVDQDGVRYEQPMCRQRSVTVLS